MSTDNAQITAQAIQLLEQGFTYRQLENQLGVPISRLHRLITKANQQQGQPDSLAEPEPLVSTVLLAEPLPAQRQLHGTTAYLYERHRRRANLADQQQLTKDQKAVAHQQRVNDITRAQLLQLQERLRSNGQQYRRDLASLEAGQQQLINNAKKLQQERKKVMMLHEETRQLIDENQSLLAALDQARQDLDRRAAQVRIAEGTYAQYALRYAKETMRDTYNGLIEEVLDNSDGQEWSESDLVDFLNRGYQLNQQVRTFCQKQGLTLEQLILSQGLTALLEKFDEFYNDTQGLFSRRKVSVTFGPKTKARYKRYVVTDFDCLA